MASNAPSAPSIARGRLPTTAAALARKGGETVENWLEAERERGEHPEAEQAVYVEAAPGERRVEHEREQ